MKMNVGYLKAHLSKVLRDVRDTGETVEVCVREKPVAYLTSASRKNGEPGTLPDNRRLASRFESVGLSLRPPQSPSPVPYKPQTRKAGDGRTDVSTVPAMRAEKEW